MTYISLEKAQELGDNFWSKNYAAMLEADQEAEDQELDEEQKEVEWGEAQSDFERGN